MTDYSVCFTARARRDLIAIRKWLLQPGSGLKAQLRIARISRALVELQFRPDRWPPGAVDGTRQRLIEGHTIVYKCNAAAKAVTVMRVFGPFQDRSTP